jgi:hypothetical protein
VAASSDDGAVSYDGMYKRSSKEGFLDVEVTVTVPEGVRLVTGFPEKDVPYSFRVNATLPAPRAAKPQEAVETPVQTPFGPVKLKLQFLRELPRDLAAWVQGSQRHWADVGSHCRVGCWRRRLCPASGARTGCVSCAFCGESKRRGEGPLNLAAAGYSPTETTPWRPTPAATLLFRQVSIGLT